MLKSIPVISLLTLCALAGCGEKQDSKIPAPIVKVKHEAAPAAVADAPPPGAPPAAPATAPAPAAAPSSDNSGSQSPELAAINKALIAYGNAGSGLPPYSGLQDLVKQHLLPSIPQPPAGMKYLKHPQTGLYVLVPE